MIKKIANVYKPKALKSLLANIRACIFFLKKKYYSLKFKNAPAFKNPTEEDFHQIESDLIQTGIELQELTVEAKDFERFKNTYSFPDDYHGGKTTGVWQEKLFEHYMAYKLLGFENLKPGSVYIDVAGNESPWAKIIRDIHGNTAILSYSIDLNPPTKFEQLDYYIQMDATKTIFENESVDGVSLQCAYEMFVGESDIDLVKELKRILKPGGKAIISPLYLHTIPCHYASPDFYGKGYGDNDSREYIRWDCYGIYSSRRYSAKKLKCRILDIISQLGLKYKIYVLRNQKEIHEEIYMHFILEIEK